MQTVTVTREIDAQPDAVREQLRDLEAFTLAAGFDEVTVAGDELRVANRVGVAEIELQLAVVDADADLAYEQVAGIFEAMRTEYDVQPADAGTRVTATTEFALDVPVVGDVLDATLIARQRRRELTAQLDWLAAEAPDATA